MNDVLSEIRHFMLSIENFDLCRIYEEDGKKMIKLLCYFYENDEGWQIVEYCWGHIELSEYVKDDFALDEFQMELKQCQRCVGTSLQVFDTLIHYWDGELNSYPVLSKDEITMDTPNGLYLIGW